MDLAISAVASDLTSRFVSFIINRFSVSSCAEEKVERLQRLLQRVETVVEEANGRYITNSGMLSQLRILEEAMYLSYHTLHTIKYRGHEEEVSNGSLSLYFSTPLKRFQRSGPYKEGAGSAFRWTVHNGDDLQSALASLESVVTNMTEFVILLGSCERMPRRPYDTYLYMENCMFGRHAEKQQAINILLQPPLNNNAPTVLPIIGGRLIGKKTLVAHVCNDERVRAQFSSILLHDRDNLQIMDNQRDISGKALLIVELTTDITDEEWTEFYSSVISDMGEGSKVILITRLGNLARFGTVKPICLNSLTYEEYSYMFRVLSFGSTDMEDHPRLASMVQEFPLLLRGSLVSAYAFADMLKKNMSPEFWASVLDRFRGVVESNMCMFGEHPKLLLERDRPTDIARFISPSAAPLRLMPPRNEADTQRRPLPMLTFGELIKEPRILPRGDFDLVTWESKIAPYSKYLHFVPAAYAEEKAETLPTRRKRRAVFL